MIRSMPHQQGSALGISLLLLVVMTLIGIVAMRIAITEERMAGNLRSHENALQAGEFGLRDAENWLNELAGLPHEVRCKDNNEDVEDADEVACSEATGFMVDSATEDSIGAIARVLRSDDEGFDNWDKLNDKSYADWQSQGQPIKQTITTPGEPDPDGGEDAPEPPDATAVVEVPGVALGRQPRYIIRERAFLPDGLALGTGVPPGRYLYEISAVGVGAQESTKRVVQSTFIRRF